MAIEPTSLGGNQYLKPLDQNTNRLAYLYNFISLANAEPSLGIPSTITYATIDTAYYFPIIAVASSYNNSRRFSNKNNTLVYKNDNIGIGTDNPNHRLTIIGTVSAAQKLMIGENQTSDGFLSSVLGGSFNTVSGDYSTIVGGTNNVVLSAYSYIGGGILNQVNDYSSVIVGGSQNIVAGNASTIVGGNNNIVCSCISNINGGLNNEICVDSHGSGVNSGCGNIIKGEYSSINGGRDNCIIVSPLLENCGYSSIVAGRFNKNYGSNSSILGGFCNTNSGDYGNYIQGGGRNTIIDGSSSSILGGYRNTVSGYYNIINGGQDNKVAVPAPCIGASSVLGGRCNIVCLGNYSTISGGYANFVCQDFSSIAGGRANTVSGVYSTIVGGRNNLACGYASSILGGQSNQIYDTGCFSSIAGGRANTASGYYSTVSGGYNNTVIGNNSSVLGGSNNYLEANNSFVLGSNIAAANINDTTFVENLSVLRNITSELRIKENVDIEKNLIVYGTLSALGGSVNISTNTVQASSLDINNLGVGPALRVFQDLNYPISTFVSNQNTKVLYVGNTPVNILDGTTGKVGINTETPLHEFTVNGSISSNDIIYTNNGNSDDWNYTAQKAVTSIGDGTNNTFVYYHNFNTRDVITQVYDNITYDVVYPQIVNSTLNSVTITFAFAPATNRYRLVVKP